MLIYGRFYLDQFQICKKVFVIDSNPKTIEWLCYNATDNGADHTLALRGTQLNQDSYFINPKNFSNYIIQAFHEYGLTDGLTIYNRNEDFIEVWAFYTTYENSILSTNILNSKVLDVCTKFKAYFERNMSVLDLQYQIGIEFSNGIDLSPISSQNVDSTDVLSSLISYRDVIKINNQEFKLSKREWECWRFMALGQSTKMTANHLGGISARTVESYIDNLKRKTGCYDKSSLATLFIKNFKDWI